jgi:hypothetical protein
MIFHNFLIAHCATYKIGVSANSKIIKKIIFNVKVIELPHKIGSIVYLNFWSNPDAGS